MLQVSATVHLAWSTSQWIVHLIDLSRTGVAFASTRSLENGSSFLLSFWLPGAERPCTTEGTVVYCVPVNAAGLFRVGAQLKSMSLEVQERIMDFVTKPSLVGKAQGPVQPE